VRLKGSPALGQDSAEVLSNWLGIGAGEIEGLRRDGII
jgi:crotonobetainyl-CoA:carnitine CoA-transferase CaiB-like acyl-CoA transferase